MLYAAESLLFCCRNQRAVAHDRGRRIGVEGIDSKNDHLFSSLPPAALCSGDLSIFFCYPTNFTLDLILSRADRITFQSLVFFGLRIFVCLAVAWIAFMLFESNTPRFCKYLRSRLTHQSA